MSKSGKIKENLKRALGIYGLDLVSIYVCQVTAISQSSRTCDVTVVHGDAAIEIKDVNLSAVPNDGLLLLPTIQSIILVGVTVQQRAFVLQYSDLLKFSLIIENAQILMDATSITLMDGSFEGLVKVVSLTTKLNNLENDINILKQSFASWVVSPSDGGAALKAITTTWFSNLLTPTLQSELENQYIKHGVPQ